jgi:hypothetical protein
VHGAASARIVHFETEYGKGSSSTVLEVGSGEGYASGSGSILKRASGGEGERPKKKVRVAFA